MKLKNIVKLTGHALTIQRALEVAVQEYAKHAAENAAQPRIAAQFRLLEARAQAVLDLLEKYEGTHFLLLAESD